MLEIVSAHELRPLLGDAKILSRSLSFHDMSYLGRRLTSRWLLAALVVLGHAGLLSAQPNEPVPSITRVYREIGGDSLHAYVFLPAGDRESKAANAILLFHGGGWSAGAAE